LWIAAALATGTTARAEDVWQRFPDVAHTVYAEPNGDRAIALSIVVAATPQQCFDAFATTDGFRSWAVPVASIDLRVGGAIESSYDPKAKIGDRGNIKNEIVAFIPAELLVIKNIQAPRTFTDPELFQRTVSIILLQPVDSGHTRVRIVNSGYGSGERSTALMKKFEWGNAYTLAQLKARFEKGPTDWSDAGKREDSAKADKAVDP
jgi:uncharacterized protein YndB with AHSA1/START domain